MSEKEPTPETEPTTPQENAMDEQDRTPDETPDALQETTGDEDTAVLETGPTEPVRPAEQTGPTEPTEQTGPAEPTEQTGPAEPAEQTGPAEPAGSADELAAAIREPFPAPDEQDDQQAWAAARAAYHRSADERPRSGRHPVNVGHLVMGLAFAGLVGIWALVVGDVIDNEDVRWLLPIPWVLAGVAGLLATTLGGRRREA